MSINRGMRRNNGEFIRRIIITTAIGVLVILATLIYNQNNKIKQLETDLYLKQQVQEKATDTTISLINVKTIQEKFNELKSYSILKNSKVNMTHTYMFEEDSFLGLKKRATLKGSANLVYSYDVYFSNATVTQDNNGTITVEIDKPTLDMDSVHYENDTLLWQQNDYNLLCGEKEGEKVTKYFLETFVEVGREKIKDMYTDKDMNEQLNRIAVLEVQELIQGLNLNDCTVVVKLR